MLLTHFKSSKFLVGARRPSQAATAVELEPSSRPPSLRGFRRGNRSKLGHQVTQLPAVPLFDQRESLQTCVQNTPLVLHIIFDILANGLKQFFCCLQALTLKALSVSSPCSFLSQSSSDDSVHVHPLLARAIW